MAGNLIFARQLAHQKSVVVFRGTLMPHCRHLTVLLPRPDGGAAEVQLGAGAAASGAGRRAGGPALVGAGPTAAPGGAATPPDAGGPADRARERDEAAAQTTGRRALRPSAGKQHGDETAFRYRVNSPATFGHILGTRRTAVYSGVV